MGYKDYCEGPLRDHHRDPFPHSLLRTRQLLGKWDFPKIRGTAVFWALITTILKPSA